MKEMAYKDRQHYLVQISRTVDTPAWRAREEASHSLDGTRVHTAGEEQTCDEVRVYL